MMTGRSRDAQPGREASGTEMPSRGQALSREAEAEAGNKRETGARVPKERKAGPEDEFSQDAAANKPPAGIGNSEPANDVEEKTRHGEGRNIEDQ